MTDLRSAVVRLLNEVHDLRLEGNNPSLRAALADVRDALAHPAPPAEGEVGELVDWLRSSACYHDAVNDEEEAAAGCRRAPVQQEPPADFIGNEKGFAQEHLARLMRDVIGNETNHNAYIVAAGKILDRPEFAYVAQCSHHAPAQPADGEVAELVAWLRSRAADIEAEDYTTIYSPTPLNRAAELLQRQHPQPVPVSERPWEREGWCDERGRCLWTAGKFETLPLSWWLVNDPMSCTSGFMLPAHALPLPAGKMKP